MHAAIDEFTTPRPIAGWRVVFTAFCMALGAWGLGFYSLSVYVQYLSAAGRFSVPLLSTATSWFFLVGAAALYGVEAVVRRIGRRRVVMAGVVLMGLSVSALPWVPNALWLFVAYSGMAFGWAAISGTAITHIVGAWFERRRGLALNLALTGASGAGVLIVPPLVWGIGRFGLAVGVATTAALVAVALLVLLHFNLVEPHRAPVHGAASSASAAPAAALRFDARLTLLCALFAIGWLAQVAFLSQQLPLLVPKIGTAPATLAVALTTVSSLLGRLVLASAMDRIDHRRATFASFALQAAGMALMLASDEPGWVIAGSCLVGASVGNVITLPAMFAQREFAAPHYGAVVTRVWSAGQVLYAFGPMGAGFLQAATGSPRATLLACLVCQAVAALLALVRPGSRADAFTFGAAPAFPTPPRPPAPARS